MDTRTNNNRILALKLLHDALALTLIFGAGMLVIESLLPGFIADFFGFTPLFILGAALIAGISYLRKKLPPASAGTEAQAPALNRLPIWALIIIAILLLNSLFRFEWWEAVIAASATGLLFHHLTGKSGRD